MMKKIACLLCFGMFSFTALGTLVGQEISYSFDETTMKGYVVYDDAFEGPRPGVLVVHEWWGHNAYARSRADQLARMGYIAMAVDMYGEGKTAEHPDEAGKFAGAVMSNVEEARKRFDAAMVALHVQEQTDRTRTAAIGYCFGGGVVLHMARFGLPLAGVASFHGSLGTKTPAQSGVVKAKILVCHGAVDPLVPPEAVEAFKSEMTAAGVDFVFKAYPGATHSFTNPDADAFAEKYKLPLGYSAEADQQSWKDLTEFLTEIFKK